MGQKIRSYKTHCVKHKVAEVLMIDGTPFKYLPAEGIVFVANQEYVDKLIERLMRNFGVSLKPIIKVCE